MRSLEIDLAPAFFAVIARRASSRLDRMSPINCFEDVSGAKSESPGETVS